MEQWAARREKRLWPVGERKAVHLGDGPMRAAHIDPDAPRLIVEWGGYQWVPLTIVEDYVAACRFLNPMPAEPPKSGDLRATRSPMAEGTGRHRKP
ncbi:DUF6087 family protein [Streptomyces sp. NPDC090442]|uniref:DUF6087 family protein n=1 Tax=Streptomyces sp. NPDC090442 TaxID=3365962 RepID=UPI0038040CDF